MLQVDLMSVYIKTTHEKSRIQLHCDMTSNGIM